MVEFQHCPLGLLRREQIRDLRDSSFSNLVICKPLAKVTRYIPGVEFSKCANTGVRIFTLTKRLFPQERGLDPGVGQQMP